tara:strand:- start:96 stop:479 length:384 start_codon:yes stop_codon:yes gene_type:complete
MSKKKSNQKKTNSNKRVNKGVKAKSKVKTSNKGKKPVNKSKKTQIQKAKQILSQQTWRNTKDSSGKTRKGRRKSLKLRTQGDTNRYQTIIKTISDYYKKAGFDIATLFIIFTIFLVVIFYAILGVFI